MKREELLKTDKSELDAQEIPFQLKTEKLELEIWLTKREKEVADLELRVKRMKSSVELDVDSILDAMDTLSLVKRRLEQGRELMQELF